MTEARAACYDQRDRFFLCLVQASAAAASSSARPAAPAAASPTAPPPCAAERAAFEGACPRAWVKYWDARVKQGQPLKVPGSN